MEMKTGKQAGRIGAEVSRLKSDCSQDLSSQLSESPMKRHILPLPTSLQTLLLLGAVFQGFPQQQHQGYPREGLHGQPSPADNVSTSPAPGAVCFRGMEVVGVNKRNAPRKNVGGQLISSQKSRDMKKSEI